MHSFCDASLIDERANRVAIEIPCGVVRMRRAGFRSSLDHLAPLMLRNEAGGITMTGRLATQVAADPRIHLVGYGPSASTIGANRAGSAAASELGRYLGLLS